MNKARVRYWKVNAERIFSALQARGIRAADLSKATGIPESTISCWKAKRWRPSYQSARAIADYLQVPLEEFLEESTAR